MFTSTRDWQPPAAAWAKLWESDEDFVEFAPWLNGVTAVGLLGSVDPAVLTDAQLVDAMAGWGKVASHAQVRQSAVIAEFAQRRPPEWLGDDEARVSRYATEEIVCSLSLTVRGADNRSELARRLDESLPTTRDAWETGELDWPSPTGHTYVNENESI